MLRRTISLSVLLAISVILAGCSVSIATNVNEDGSGNLGLIYIFPKGTYTCREAQSQGLISEDLSVTQDTTRDGSISCTANSSFSNLAQLKQKMDKTNLVSVHELSVQNYTFTYNLDVFPRSQDAGVYDMYWMVSPPGKLVRHNADNVSNGILTWKLHIGQRNNISIESALPIPPTPTPPSLWGGGSQGGSNPWPVIIGLVVVGGIGSLVWRQRQRGAGSAGSSSPAPATAAPSSAEERIQHLRDLHERGLIDDDEFTARKNKILDDL
jgi:hypothetical protein